MSAHPFLLISLHSTIRPHLYLYLDLPPTVATKVICLFPLAMATV
jgi:hypothetical protein